MYTVLDFTAKKWKITIAMHENLRSHFIWQINATYNIIENFS